MTPAGAAPSKPVEDTIAKVDGEVAVGEDLDFQRKWWKFERGVWAFFALILLLDLLGAFGHGPLARGQRRSDDGSIAVRYERIERTGTPSILTVDFGPAAVHDGKVTLFVSESIVKELGAQRVIPSPESTTVGNGGLTYVFPVSTAPASIEFALQPPGPGLLYFSVQVPGSQQVAGKIAVMP